MRLILTTLFVLVYIFAFSQGCSISTSNLIELSGDDGSGNCTYSLDILFTEGSGPDNGTLTFTLTNGTLLTGGGPHSCVCSGNTYTITFKAVCGATISITAFHDNSGAGNDCTITETGITLPVIWLTYEIIRRGNNQVELFWSTAFEVNNELFHIEESIDGDSFVSVGTVEGSGTSNARNDYSFIHKSKKKGNVYYRIKQVDFDGKYTFSSVKSIKLNDLNQLSIYPNPTTAILNVRTNGQNLRIHIFDFIGRKVHSSQDQKIDLNHLPNGIYFLQAEVDQEVISRSFVKSN